MSKIFKKTPREVVQKADAITIMRAAGVLKNGGIVAFPTETVYGLGANALDAKAVAKIFVAKGRPSDNPLIVHIADAAELAMVAKDVPEIAIKLMKKFWPGPLTFVLKKTSVVPDNVTAGGKTVAVRMPAHKIALKLIQLAGCPVAAPSANLAGKPSPTSAAHVAEDLADRIDMILDGGATKHGLESTVIDFTGGANSRVEILRTGAITPDMLAKVLGYTPKIAVLKPQKATRKNAVKKTAKTSVDLAVRSPGMKYKHYAPKVKMLLVTSKKGDAMIKFVQKKIVDLQKKGLRVGILCCSENAKFYKKAGSEKVVVCGSSKKLASVASKLFASLRLFEPKDVDVIVAENFGKTGIGHAVMDRLERAASEKL